MAEELWDRAESLNMAGRVDEAVAMVRMHVKLRPKDLDAVNLLGSLLQQAGQIDQALHHHGRLVADHPTVVAFRHNLANTLVCGNRPAEAIPHWERLVREDPNFAMGWAMLAAHYPRIGESLKAIDAAHRCLALQPEFPGVLGNLIFAMINAGRMDTAIQLGQETLARRPGDHILRSALLMNLNYLQRPAAEMFEMHRAFGRQFPPPTPAPHDHDPDRPLRIGILSAEFRDHSVGFFLDSILKHREPNTQIIAFSNWKRSMQDATTRRMKGLVNGWFDVGEMPDASLDALIREQRIDVLLELSGHTGDNRLVALSAKPAPVIVTAIGYPNTTGLPAVDWRLVDTITDPPGSEALCTERLLRLDPCFLCYSPPEHAPSPVMPPDDAPITFGSFNSTLKIVPETTALWSRVMQAVPDARLLLKSTSMRDAAARERLLHDLAAAGIDGSRVELIAYAANRDDHLRLYNRVHVALDTVPYNGTTTTCEALWMGVPVLTTLGDRHAARVSASLLTALGHPEWIATSPDMFVETARALTADRARLADLRGSLRAAMQASPLCDSASYAKRLHAALRACWRDHCAAHA